jgi:hypothetical protein
VLHVAQGTIRIRQSVTRRARLDVGLGGLGVLASIGLSGRAWGAKSWACAGIAANERDRRFCFK